MTVSSEVSSIAFAGNGTVGPYPCNFKIFDDSHVQVFVDGVLKELGTDYTVSGVGDDTFDLTFTSAVGLSSTVAAARVVPLMQLTDYVENDEFPAETHERALDLLVMMCQQINSGNTGKAVRFPPTDAPNLNALLPSAMDRASKLLAFDTAGEVVAVEGADLGTFSPGSAHTWTATQTLEGAAGADGWVLADQSGNTRAKFRRTAGGAGKVELFDNSDVSRFYVAPDSDPAMLLQVAADVDALVVEDLSGNDRIALRHRSSGDAAIDLYDKDNVSFCSILVEDGDPEGVRTGNPGTILLRTSGGVETSLYVKESGTGNTGWKAVRTKGFDPIKESAEQTITSGSLTNVAHGLGVRPRKVWGVLRCTTADIGYAVGDEIEVFAYRDDTSNNRYGVVVGADTTNVFFTVGTNGLHLMRKDTGADGDHNNSSWRVVLRWEA